jgi:uracil-DNA glycosylase
LKRSGRSKLNSKKQKVKIMNRIEEYKSLVGKRKKCSLCKGLYNPSSVLDGIYDTDQIGPWTCWQGKLDADVVVVGQDWADIDYFKEVCGRCKPSNPTNENLRKLLSGIGLTIKRPQEPQDQVLFLTNLILCLKPNHKEEGKKGGLQGPVDDEWFANCSYTFFKPLMDIVNPKIIIALGKEPSKSILTLYGISYSKSAPLSEMIKQSPYILMNTMVLFPVYHCGAGGVNRNRSMSEQQEDWSKIGKYLKSL